MTKRLPLTLLLFALTCTSAAAVDAPLLGGVQGTSLDADGTATASIALPNVTLDYVLPYGLGTQDVAQVLRLDDQ